MKGLKAAVAALYVGLAVAVLAGVYLAREVESLRRSINELVKPEPIVGMPSWRMDAGQVIYSRDIRVSSPIVLEGLEILLEAPGLRDVKLLALNDKNAVADIVTIKEGAYRIYIKHPFGTYRVEAATPRAVPVAFDARF